MNPAVYWRSALGLFWSFMFFMLLALVVGMTYLSKLVFYPYAIFFSAILLIFLTAFLLFDKRIKAGLYMCLILSSLFVFNQVLMLYLLFFEPSKILPGDMFNTLAVDRSIIFPGVVSFLLLLWAVFLFASVWKSKPVFSKDMMSEQLKWLVQVKKETLAPARKAELIAQSKKPAKPSN